MIKDLYLGIKKFMRFAGQDVPTRPTQPDSKTIKLRQDLIEEEFREYKEAVSEFIKANDHTEFVDALVKVADALADLLYVVVGAGIAFGLPLPTIVEYVHQANMRKFANGSYRREDGKWMKPPGWKGPEEEIKNLIVELGLSKTLFLGESYHELATYFGCEVSKESLQRYVQSHSGSPNVVNALRYFVNTFLDNQFLSPYKEMVFSSLSNVKDDELFLRFLVPLIGELHVDSDPEGPSHEAP
jgi:predicted HAD superfamily Cof-like phosphohydrolase